MFGKLLKYDFRSMCKQFALLWPAALALALVNRFTLFNLDSASSVAETTAGFAMIVYIAILVAMFIIALIFAIQRFYRGLLGDEGYLMFTLPVRPWQLIGSKLLCATATTFLSIAVAILSVLLIAPWSAEDLRELGSFFGYLFSHWDLRTANAVFLILEILLFMAASFATGYLQFYLSMSVGHLASKNRVAWSVVACIAISSVTSALGNLILPPFSNWIEPLVNAMENLAGLHAAMWLGIAGELLLSAVYFAGTEYILRKKLNLE